MKTSLCRLILLAAAMLAACSADEGGVGASADAPVMLVPVSHDQWTAMLPDYRPQVVVVDMWATWCAPCVERFPKMVALHDKYAGAGVTIVGMSLEDRDDAGAVAGAVEFLRRQAARFPNYLMNENIIDSFEKLDILGIPAVDIYDQHGTRRFRLTGDDPNNQFTDADIEAAIVALLAEG